MVKLLSIVIVTFNNQSSIESCLDSVIKNLPEDGEILVFDNASSDQTLKKIERFSQKINLIKSDQNLGFAKANNLATEKAQGEYLFFLNPDTIVSPGAIETLINFLKIHPEVGIVAPKLILSETQVQPSVRQLPTIWGAIKEYYLNRKYSYEAYAPKFQTEVESVVGAAIMIKKDIFLKVGGYDQKFFLYFEDLDLCRKILKIGLKIIYLPQSVIYHQVGGSISKQKKELIQASAKKYHGQIYFWFLNLILRLRPKANLG